MSTLRANAINDVEGTTKFYDGSPTIDLWRLSANFSTDNGTITGWERPDESSIVGVSVNGLTESSGIFTFPSTGIYHILITAQLENGSSSDGTMEIQMQTSIDSGSNFTKAASLSVGDSDTGTNNGSASQIMLNVTNTSTTQFKFLTASINSGSFIHGQSGFNITEFSCIKVLPGQ